MITSASFPPREGIGQYILELSKQLKMKNHEIIILTRGSFSRSMIDRVNGIDIWKITYLPLYPFHIDFHAPFVQSLVRRINPDLIHYHSPIVPFLNLNIPSVTTVHTPMTFDIPNIEIVDARSLATRMMLFFSSRRIETKLFLKSDLIATVSNQVANEISEMGIPQNRIRVVGNGVNEKIFTPSKRRRDEDSILAVGRLAYRKGWWDLLEASRLVTDAIPNAIFRIVGDGPLRKNLENYIIKKKLTENVKLLGRISREELISHYQSCSMFILPSHYEGMATVLLEAMSCGSPVISTRIGGSVELIKNNINGLLIPKKDPSAISTCIINLLSDKAFAENMGIEARNTIESRYSWNKISDIYNNINDILIN